MSQSAIDHLIIALNRLATAEQSKGKKSPPKIQHMNYSPAHLASALDAYDVPFLFGGTTYPRAAVLPRELLIGLATAPEARLRAAIIPLLLRHPEFADAARAAAQELEPLPRQTLQCFYTAAMLLQRKYALRLGHLLATLHDLPDFFSRDLNVMLGAEIENALRAVGRRHAAFAGHAVNWVGTYEHAAQHFMKHLEQQAH